MAAGFASELWPLPRIAILIKERFGVELSEPSVWRMLQQLGWSVQRPAGRVREGYEAAIRTCKEKRCGRRQLELPEEIIDVSQAQIGFGTSNAHLRGGCTACMIAYKVARARLACKSEP